MVCGVCGEIDSFVIGLDVRIKKPSFFDSVILFNGRGRIRTSEGITSRFTVCPIWPLWNTPVF